MTADEIRDEYVKVMAVPTKQFCMLLIECIDDKDMYREIVRLFDIAVIKAFGCGVGVGYSQCVDKWRTYDEKLKEVYGRSY